MATDVRQNVMATLATNQARGAQYKIAGKQLNRQLVDSSIDVVEQAGKVATSAINADKEKKLQELQYAWEQEKAKGTFDYIDGVKENGEEYSYENVLANSDAWIDSWLEQNGGYLQKMGMLKSVTSNYKESLKSSLIEETRNRAYNAIQTYNAEKVAALTSVYTDYNNYDINKDVAMTFADEGYTTIEQLVDVEEYGIGEAAERYISAYNSKNTEEEQKAIIDLRLAFAAKTTGQATESFAEYRDENIDSIYRSADLAQFTKSWILNPEAGIVQMYKEKGSDSDILDSAYKEFLNELVTKGVELQDETISWFDLSEDDLAKLKSDFSEYGSLVLSSAVAEQEKAYAESETYYNNEIANGTIYMSLQEEVDARVKSSGGVLSPAYVKKQIPATRVAEYSERESITKLGKAYTVLASSTSTEDERDAAIQSLKNLGMVTFVKTKLGLGSDLKLGTADDVKDNTYMQNLQRWMVDNGSDLAHAIVANDGLSSSSSSSSKSSSNSSSTGSSGSVKLSGLAEDIAGSDESTGDSGSSNMVDVLAETTDPKIDAFWNDAKEVKTELEEDGIEVTLESIQERMRAKGYEVDDATAPAYYLWNAYQFYSGINILEEDDSALEAYRSITKLKTGNYSQEDVDRVNNYQPTIDYYYNQEAYQVGYMLSNSSTYDAECASYYALAVLSNKVEYYIQNGDYEGFDAFIKAIGSTYKTTEQDWTSNWVPDKNGKRKKDSAELISSIYDSYKTYTVNAYTGFTAKYKDSELQLADGTLGKFDDILKQDVAEAFTSVGQTFLKVYKYNNPTWDISKGYKSNNGTTIPCSDTTLLEMGEYSSTFKDYCSLLLTCETEAEKQSVLNSAQKVMTNEAFEKLKECESTDLKLKASGISEGVVDMAKKTMGTSSLAGLLDNDSYNGLPAFMASDAEFNSKIDAILLQCEKDGTDPYAQVYSLVGEEVMKYVYQIGPNQVALNETGITAGTGFDMGAALDAIQSQTDYNKKSSSTNEFWNNYFENINTYKSTVNYGNELTQGVMNDIFNVDGNSSLGEGVNSMLNVASTIGTSSEVSMVANAEDLLYLCIALDTWDPSRSITLTAEDLSSTTNLATKKYQLAEWWSSLDDTNRVLVRDTACALANTYGFFKDYNGLDLGDAIKYKNGGFYSSKFGKIERGGTGFYYTDSEGNKINLTTLSDKTPTKEIVEEVLPESLSGKAVLRGDFSPSTLTSIQNHNIAKSDAEGLSNKEAGGQYVLVAVPDCIAKDSYGFVYAGSIFSRYEITEYTLEDVAQLYEYYSKVEIKDPILKADMETQNFTFDTFKQELLSMLSPSQAEYVKNYASIDVIEKEVPKPKKVLEEPNLPTKEKKYAEIDSDAFRNARTFAKEHGKSEIGTVYQYLNAFEDKDEFEDAVNGLLYETEDSYFLLEKAEDPEAVINGYADAIRKNKGWAVSEEIQEEAPTQMGEQEKDDGIIDSDAFRNAQKFVEEHPDMTYAELTDYLGAIKNQDEFEDALQGFLHEAEYNEFLTGLVWGRVVPTKARIIGLGNVIRNTRGWKTRE